MKKLFALSLVILLSSCFSTQSENEIKSISINPEKSKKTELSSISSNITFISLDLPDSIFFGEVTDVQEHKELLFLMDGNQSKTITIVDKKGKYINQLNRSGDGPEEYSGIFAFLINQKENHLVIYDRASFKLVYYSLPDLKFLKTKKLDSYYTAIANIDNSSWLAISDTYADDGIPKGVQIINSEDLKSTTTSFRKYPIALMYSQAPTISHVNNNMYYAYPGEKSKVYEVSSQGFEPIVEINFGNKSMDQDLWAFDIKETGNFMSIHSQEERSSTAQRFQLNDKNQQGSFWFFRKSYATPYLATFDLNSSQTELFNEVTLNELNTTIQSPIGIVDGNYVNLIPYEVFQASLSSNKEVEMAIKRKSPLLLLYKPKM